MLGTILLTYDNIYLNTDDNSLPSRPEYDKELLTALCKGNTVSEDGYYLLPKSIQKQIVRSTIYNIPITIRELAKADILIVSRSYQNIVRGKVFRLDDFKLIVKDKKIEIWGRK